MLLPPVSACANAVSDSAVCAGLSDPLDALVAVVVDEGSDAVVLAAEALTVKYDAGCG